MSEEERSLFFLPVKMGGLGIRDPVSQAERSFRISKMATMEIVSVIRGDREFSVMTHFVKISQAQSRGAQEWNSYDQEKVESVLEFLEPHKKRVIMHSVNGKTWDGCLCYH